MKVTAKVKNNVKTAKVKRKVQTANLKSVQHTAATLRLIILRSLRKGKKTESKQRIPSSPGSAPRTWENKTKRRMKRDVLYTPAISDLYGQSASAVYARPEKSGDRVYQMHEKGGQQLVWMQLVNGRKRRKSRFRERRVTKSGQIEKYTYRLLSERSEKEQNAIKKYYKNERRLKGKKVAVQAHYPARPFMEPAVKKLLPRLPQVWKTKIQQQFY